MNYHSSQYSQSQPEKIVDFANKLNWYRRLQLHVTQIKHLQSLFDQVVDGSLVQQCRCLEIKDGVLLLEVDNASWATRVRFLTPDWMKKLRRFPEFAQVKNIQCLVKPVVKSTEQRVKNHTYPISKETAAIIRETAESIADVDLKAALLRLINSKASPP